MSRINIPAGPMTVGTIDEVIVGGTTPAAGSFTTLNSSDLTASQGLATDGSKNLITKTIGIADNNLLEVDHVSPADNDFAKFTTSGLEGRSYSEVMADLSGQAAAAFDFNGQYALQLQNILDLAAKGAGYWFDKVDDVVVVSDNPLMDDIFDNGGSIIALIKPCSSGESAQGRIADKASPIFFVASNSGNFTKLKFTQNFSGTQGSWQTTAFPIPFNAWSLVTIIYDNSSVANDPVFLVNGKVFAVTEVQIPVGTRTSDNGQDLTFGGNGAGSSTFDGEIAGVWINNLSFDNTDPTDKALINGAPVPRKYTEKASQTELMPNQVDRDFSGASAWADVDLAGGGGAYDETDDLTITAGGAGIGDYCTCPVLSVPTTIGLEYRMTYDLANIVGSWTLQSFDGAQTIGTISANATQANLEWTAETTGGYRLVAAENNASGDFDNFTLNHIGCVGQWEQDGIGHNQWIDKSGNELHGATSGALPTNLATDHTEKYVDLTVTGNTSFTLPKGYQIKSIIVKETAGNALTGGLDCGLTTDGVEIVSGMAVGANATVLCTLVAAGTIGGTFTTAADTIYLSDGDDDTNWNSASLEARIQMQRLTVN